MNSGEYILCDLDGVLAHVTPAGEYDGMIGEPVPAMVARVSEWLKQGIEVRIFTARVGHRMQSWRGCTCQSVSEMREFQREVIQSWCMKHLQACPIITASKDYLAVAIYDDRAVQVVRNTGELVAEVPV